MIDAGYFAKHIVTRPDWPEGVGGDEICSVCHCVSRDPDGWTDRWRHNGLAGSIGRPTRLEAVPPASATCFGSSPTASIAR